MKATLPTERIVTIEGLTHGPWGIGHSEGQVVFVSHSAPGDRVRVRVTAESRNFLRADPVEIIRASPLRIDPPCPYYPRCGGCQWQHVQYQEQLRWKETNVRECLARIGKIKNPPVRPILPSPSPWRYRMRIRLHANESKETGLYSLLSHSIVPIESCLLLEEPIESLLKPIANWVRSLKSRLDTVDVCRPSERSGVILRGELRGAFHPDDDRQTRDFLEKSPLIQAVVLSARGWTKKWGAAPPEAGGEGFLQPNRSGNAILVEEVLRLGGFQPGDRVLDLHCGSGNFTLPIASRVQRVMGLDSDPHAIRSARRLAKELRVTNASFLVGLAEEQKTLLTGGFNKLILDPPREGALALVQSIGRDGPREILYVSCNPATLARDLALLLRNGYELREVQPVDLFPQTYHVETLAAMVLA